MNHRALLPRRWRLYSGFVLVMILSLLMAVSATAQDEVPLDEPIGEVLVIEETLGADSVNTVIEIPVTRDAFIASNRPNSNFGRVGDLRLGFDPNQGLGAMRMLMFFSLDRIPRQATINSAQLRVNLTSAVPSNDSSMGFEARYLNSNWSEGVVTWATHQPEWGSVFASGQLPSATGWHVADVTRLVRDWHSGARANFGFTVIGDERPNQNRQRIYVAKEANNGLFPRLIVDYSVTTDTTPPVARVRPLPEWSPENFQVSWEGSDPNNPNGSAGSGIRHYDVWYSRNGGQNWIDWRAQVTSTRTDFRGGEHLQVYDFTARAVDNAGNVQPRGGTQARTRVDAQPPQVSMSPLPQYTGSSSFNITWGGTDSGSGIAGYDVQWRENEGPWQTLMSNTQQTSFFATGARNGVLYEFRARGIDRVGNAQPFPEQPQAATTVWLEPVAYIVPFDPPLFQNLNGPEPGDGFTVRWDAVTPPGASVSGFDVRYQRPNSNAWLTWQSNTRQTSARFDLDAGDPDGVYVFQARARRDDGTVGSYDARLQGAITVDRLEPFIEERIWMPLVAHPEE